MPRESAEAKGRRYLAEGRLVVREVAGELVRAACRGSGSVYSLGHDPDRGWWCNCPAYSTCAHLHALRLVTVRRRR